MNEQFFPFYTLKTLKHFESQLDHSARVGVWEEKADLVESFFTAFTLLVDYHFGGQLMYTF